MKRNMKEWVKSVISSKNRHAMPIMTYPGLNLVNKKITDAVTDGKVHFECIYALSSKYPSSATTSIMDLSLEAETFGSPIRFSDDDVPTVTGKIAGTKTDIEKLRVPQAGEKRTAQCIKAVQLAASKITDKPVFAGMIGPFSLSGRLFDMTEIMTAVMLEPDTIALLLDKVTTFLKQLAASYKAAGANGIIIAEPAAGLLSPDMCSEFSSQYVRKIVESVQDDSFMVVLHNCGADTGHVPTMLSTGAMGLHFGNKVNMPEILKLVPDQVLVFGNVDPARTLRNGTAADVSTATRALLQSTASFKNYVLSSGCDVPPNTPLANVEAFYGELAKFNSK
jgi:uroporphyrinogen decarboxylase